MNLLERASTNEFKVLWKETFAGAMGMLDGHEQAGGFSKCESKKASHWLLLLEPLPGIRLISVEFPFTYGPPRLYLRVWTYQPDGDAQYQAIEAQKFVLSGQPVSTDPEVPPPGWQWNLKGTQIHGFRHMVDIAALEDMESAAFWPALHGIAAAFCQYVVSVCTSAAPAMGVSSAEISVAPCDSMDPAPSSSESVLAATLEPVETPAVLLADLASIDQDPRFEGLAPPMRVAVANARIGQGGYRKRMLALWEGRCALSGCPVEEILIASHALPWAECETATQCLDEYNGLLLSANLDRLFDKGLIAFRDDGSVLMRPGALVSDLVPAGGLRFVHPRHLPYLAWHRVHFGFE